MTKSYFEFGSGLKTDLYLIHNCVYMHLKNNPDVGVIESTRAGWGVDLGLCVK